jgi:hypothetical protein
MTERETLRSRHLRHIGPRLVAGLQPAYKQGGSIPAPRIDVLVD